MKRSRHILKREQYAESRLRESPLKFNVAANRPIPFKDWTDLDKTLMNYKMRSYNSYTDKNDFKTPIDLWEQVAHSRGYASAKDESFVDAVIDALGVNQTEGIQSIEFLYIHTRDQRLYKYTDFAIEHGDDGESWRSEYAIYSYMYGGLRLNLLQKYAKLAKDPKIVGQGLECITNYMNCEVRTMTPLFTKVEFKDKDSKDFVLEILQKMEKVFDFDIDEPQESSVWSIHVAKGSSDNEVFDGTGATVVLKFYSDKEALFGYLNGQSFSVRLSLNGEDYIAGDEKDPDNITAKTLGEAIDGLSATYNIKVEIPPSALEDFKRFYSGAE